MVVTGAKLSYISKKIAANYLVVGNEKVFYPDLGKFDTTVYEIPLELGESVSYCIAGYCLMCWKPRYGLPDIKGSSAQNFTKSSSSVWSFRKTTYTTIESNRSRGSSGASRLRESERCPGVKIDIC